MIHILTAHNFSAKSIAIQRTRFFFLFSFFLSRISTTRSAKRAAHVQEISSDPGKRGKQQLLPPSIPRLSPARVSWTSGGGA